MMNSDLNQGSAKIYQFPAGGRAALGGRRYGEVQMSLELAAKVETAMCSDSWYHQAAIDDAKPGRDH
ncbi:DUF2735 domain-containing protein [Bradyrhizobium sp. ISRA443]|uniref:DUF2735 domain-containing protein n=1 Tax=unclassified Bradyrhizobium TaxID=2631580 RepID=UPI002479D301|nr:MULTISPECIES: DUF2735 domain-containing protein [unclassified Bradyrhizobium]WGR92353.1 DUF2735 domain-containing protein [Bradyrhizobium sp. ISRA435]WGR96691.1 DUF2735 domain-containing protein [Bradyrhizobium sp. ISRA436]WGS03578.1 DUF2735 domain-containing protein [Bradyrhizobium sp. ISRA437]WGS10462.1 DUF2735 domain-containing protein [Bradyrhizobium sp. ISRA443]